MTPEAQLVLRAIVHAQEVSSDEALPLKRIARSALGGGAALAAKVLAELDSEGLVATDTMGWYSGWLTPKGRRLGGRMARDSGLSRLPLRAPIVFLPRP